ncbi:aTP-dependent helicase/nuclease subunit A [Clostridium sp. CAG:452]|nr:aTP-dependent helicase/nuclease subunit A [Clostridium sp. CAG:452]
MINKIIKEKIDINQLLIVTFTNAAASEMREKILEAIYKKIEEEPENKNLQKQIVLLNDANISTIHSFCLEVIKNYFYEIGISPNFRIGDNAEIKLLKQETLEEVFEELYEEENKDFIKLVDTYCGYRNDNQLRELVLKIYNYSQSMPFPMEWISENVDKFNITNKNDFSQTEWGKLLIKNFKEEAQSAATALKTVKNELKEDSELEKYYITILEDIEKIEKLLKQDSWDDIYNLICNLQFEKWPISRKIQSELKDKSKQIRDKVEKPIKDFRDTIFIYKSKEAIEDIYDMYKILNILEKVILKFSNKYQENKKEKNIIDFSDIEHFALKILVKKDENDNYIPTEVAKIYKEKFKEIAIDEYQDSNLVQEYILTTISNGKNIFMVGDVKQSIYKFRQARPELFLQKYNSYKMPDEATNECKENTKIQLFQNFRSRSSVLDITNLVFDNIMSMDLGGIEYNEKEYLNKGTEFKEAAQELNVAGKAELNIIDLKKEDEEKEEETEEKILEKSEMEAKAVANRIRKLFEDNYCVYDKKEGYRKATFKDIVILLRTTSDTAKVYEKELTQNGFPTFTDTGSNYFETEEIQIILSVLKIIDNPNNDIPLVTVLRSPIGGFTDNELIEIRLEERNGLFYQALETTKEKSQNLELKNKVNKFLNMLNDWQLKQEYLSLDELIWYIYESTNYYNFVSSKPNGELKTANLKLLFEKAKDYEKASFKGLYNFINYIDKISKGSDDMGSAKLIRRK